jgi:RHS repeat-associated protein
MTFDNFGRLTRSKQITDGVEYGGGTDPSRWMTYSYNLSGALVQETYPSGRVVKNEFESDGDLARIHGKANANSADRTYANLFTYTPDGRIESLVLGNLLWEKAKFNSRLQVTELALGHGINTGDVWKLGYEYGELDSNGNVDAAKNTGNIARQTLSFNGLAQPFVQSYKYDSLFRLTEARETSGTGTSAPQTWKETFGYDCYGNRTSHTKFDGTTQLASSNITDPTIDPATNRFQTGQGYTFDKNGNLITDAESRAFTFNADNKQSKVVQNGHLVAEYFFDGEGKRVKKKVYDPNNSNIVTEETVFVYSSGKLIAEYSTAPPPQNPTVSYTATDQLGSPRVITNAFGEVVSRRDFKPFGEQIEPDGTYRTNSLYSNAGDDIRQKFTGYQKDEETNLDFAEARMYENRHARFTAVDPLLASGKSANPQTFNRYTYVLNNPLVFTDPGGLQVATASGSVYQNGNNFAIFAGRGRVPDGYNRVRKTINTQTTINGVMHQLTVRPNGWAVGDRLDNKRFQITPAAPTSAQGDPRVSSLVKGFNQGFNNSISGAKKGAGNFGIGIINSITDELTGGSTRSMFGYGNPLEIQRYSYNNLTEAKFGLGTEFGLALGTLKAGGVFGGGGSTFSVVPRTYTLAGNRLAGLGAEVEYGITAPKRSIDSLTGTATRRFPDEITETTMTEIKNVAHLNRTNQIMDMHLWAEQEGLQFTIVTRPNTTFSAPMQEMFDSGLIRHQIYNFRSRP